MLSERPPFYSLCHSWSLCLYIYLLAKCKVNLLAIATINSAIVFRYNQHLEPRIRLVLGHIGEITDAMFTSILSTGRVAILGMLTNMGFDNKHTYEATLQT